MSFRVPSRAEVSVCLAALIGSVLVLPANAQALNQSESRLSFQPQTAGTGIRRYVAKQPLMGYEIRLSDQGQLSLAAGQDKLSLRVAAFGWGSNPGVLERANPRLERNSAGVSQLTFGRSQLSEIYENGQEGLHHSFTVQKPAKGSGGKLWIDLQVSGIDRLALTSEQSVEAFRGAHVFTYAGLRAWDAVGKPLISVMSVRGNRITLSVDDQNVAYPITIDPTWTLQQRLTSPKPVDQARFGSSVGISGDTVVVGSNVRDQQRGAAYVYVRSAGIWKIQQTLTASDPEVGDYFGTSVAIDGDYLAVSAPVKAASKGAVYIYARVNGVWSQQQKITVVDPSTYISLGYSLSMSGDTLLISADSQARNRGAAYVYRRVGTTWTQEQKLLAQDGLANDSFGWSVSVQGNMALVGAQAKDKSQGAAYLFSRTGTSWTQIQKLVASDGAAANFFGYSVAIGPDLAVIGAHGHNNYEGIVYVYRRTGNQWQESTIHPINQSSYIFFGTTVALDGDTILVAGEDLNEAGSVWAFRRDGLNWIQQRRLARPVPLFQDQFGSTLSIQGSTALAGCISDKNFQGDVSAFIVTPNRLAVSFAPASAIGGSSLVGTVDLGAPAPEGGVTVNLADDQSSLQIPATVFVAEGQTSASFDASTQRVTAPITAKVTASAPGDTSATTSVTINPGTLKVSFDSTSVMGGKSIGGTVSITPAFLASGATVTLKSDRDSAKPPSSVVIPVGESSVHFDIATTAIDAETTVTISASAPGTQSTSGTFSVKPGILSASFDPATVYGSENVNLTVTLSETAPVGGLVVSLADNQAALTLPSTATIPAGGTSVVVPAKTSLVSESVSATVSVTAKGASAATASLAINPGTILVTLDPTTVMGGKTVTGKVSVLPASIASGATVTLVSDSTSVLSPGPVVIAKGATSATFTVASLPVSELTTATISATAPGTVAAGSSAVLMVHPGTLTLAFDTGSVTGGAKVHGSIQLSEPAGPGGYLVSLLGDPKGLLIPTALKIAEGATSVGFDVLTAPVASDFTVNLTASAIGSASSSASFTVFAPKIASLSLSLASVTGGSATAGTVQLSGLAPAGGLLISLSSDTPLVASVLPSSVVVLGGTNVATFPISTKLVAKSTAVGITASLTGQSKSQILTVVPPTITMKLTPSEVFGGDGTAVKGSLTSNVAAPVGGFVFTISSSDSSVSAPVTVTMAYRAKTVLFNVAHAAVPSLRTVKINATSPYGGASAALTVKANQVKSLVLSPNLAKGGSPTVVTGTVTLAIPAGAGGVTVSLASNSAFASVPGSILIPAGKTQGTFVVNHKAVTATTSVALSAGLGGASVSATMRLTR